MRTKPLTLGGGIDEELMMGKMLNERSCTNCFKLKVVQILSTVSAFLHLI